MRAHANIACQGLLLMIVTVLTDDVTIIYYLTIAFQLAIVYCLAKVQTKPVDNLFQLLRACFAKSSLDTGIAQAGSMTTCWQFNICHRLWTATSTTQHS